MIALVDGFGARDPMITTLVRCGARSLIIRRFTPNGLSGALDKLVW
jgi:hypothetical protein